MHRLRHVGHSSDVTLFGKHRRSAGGHIQIYIRQDMLLWLLPKEGQNQGRADQTRGPGTELEQRQIQNHHGGPSYGDQ